MEGYSKHFIFALFAGTLLSACGNSGANYTPINDGPTTIGFQSDLAACQRLAKNQTQLNRQTMGKAAIGAGIGAALGSADEEGDATGGAIAGALAGGLTGVGDAREKKQSILINCMRGRGHNVVG